MMGWILLALLIANAAVLVYLLFRDPHDAGFYD